MRLVLDTNVLARVVMSPHGPAAALFCRLAQGSNWATLPGKSQASDRQRQFMVISEKER
jgi:hypothetical protein